MKYRIFKAFMFYVSFIGWLISVPIVFPACTQCGQESKSAFQLIPADVSGVIAIAPLETTLNNVEQVTQIFKPALDFQALLKGVFQQLDLNFMEVKSFQQKGIDIKKDLALAFDRDQSVLVYVPLKDKKVFKDYLMTQLKQKISKLSIVKRSVHSTEFLDIASGTDRIGYYFEAFSYGIFVLTTSKTAKTGEAKSVYQILQLQNKNALAADPLFTMVQEGYRTSKQNPPILFSYHRDFSDFQALANSLLTEKINLSQYINYISASIHLDKSGLGFNFRLKTTEASKPHLKSLLDNTVPMDPMLLKAFQKAIAVLKVSVNPQGLHKTISKVVDILPNSFKEMVKARVEQLNFPGFLVSHLFSNLTGNAFFIFYGLNMGTELLNIIAQPTKDVSSLASLFQAALIIQVKNELQFKTLLQTLDLKKIEEILPKKEADLQKQAITVSQKETEFGRTYEIRIQSLRLTFEVLVFKNYLIITLGKGRMNKLFQDIHDPKFDIKALSSFAKPQIQLVTISFETLLENIPLLSRLLGSTADIFKKIPVAEAGLKVEHPFVQGWLKLSIRQESAVTK